MSYRHNYLVFVLVKSYCVITLNKSYIDSSKDWQFKYLNKCSETFVHLIGETCVLEMMAMVHLLLHINNGWMEDLPILPPFQQYFSHTRTTD